MFSSNTSETHQQRETLRKPYKGGPLLAMLPFAVLALAVTNLIGGQRRTSMVVTRSSASSSLSTIDSSPTTTATTEEETRRIQWMESRSDHFDDWFENDNSGKLKPQADENGTVLDFLIAGFPKCGTTTLEANLGYYAPMPIADVCTPIHQTVYYSYKNWPRTYGNNTSGNNDTIIAPKIYRGSKCPRLAETQDIVAVSRHLPKTKLIIGIRHPVLWFQSFWNMLAYNDKSLGRISPYNKTQPCTKASGCSAGCPSRQLFCVHRSEFHVALARLGKTALGDDERKWLAPDNVVYGGEKVPNWNITNSLFLYEQTTMREAPMWDSLAQFLGMPEIRHDRTMGNHKDRKPKANFNPNVINICDAEWDDLRVELMLIAYDLSHWLLEYFLPVAMDPNRPDVVVHDTKQFSALVESYQSDPCGRLEHHAIGNGKVRYSLKQQEAE